MSKRRKGRKRKGKSLGLLPREKIIVEVERLQDSFIADGDREFAASLANQFKRKGFLTPRQWHFAEQLLSCPKKRASNEYFLYVMQAGDNLKFGVSKDPDKRARAIQTGNAEAVKILERVFIGTGPKAFSQERKLHRFCREYRIHGEWFSLGALSKARQFIWNLSPKAEWLPKGAESHMRAIAGGN